MHMNLVIVESPAKGKTIEKYLGSSYKVLASFGHVRDLPKKELGVDVEKDFKPKYVIPPKARKAIKILKDAAKKSENIYLATDLDREGEAIAWHVREALGLKDKYFRITFSEITKSAIIEAVNKPRKINDHLVDAQQARRVLDRLVGYKLSPFLWKKVYKGLSAGRVQSVAVRLIVEREREIKAFKPEEYWILGGNFKSKNGEFSAYLASIGDKKVDKLDIKNKEEADKIIDDLHKQNYQISDITKKDLRRWPLPPFTTSTLQQEAARRLYFSAKQTMKLAQDLYEKGKITYMRTDSLNISESARESVRKYVKTELGDKYLSSTPIIYKTKSKGAQEAHEAIRPSYVEIKPEDLEGDFEEKHRKLYDLIRRRTIACQMSPAQMESMQVSVLGGKYMLRANGNRLVFDGFYKYWQIKREDMILPELSKNEKVDLKDVISDQKFTEPPARYSEATLVKALEEHEIGRPSTYAPIISTIQDRGYVVKENGRFIPNEIAFIVIDLLVKNFSDIVNIEFTASMENKLDDIADNKLSYEQMLSAFYGPFEKNLESKTKEVEKVKTEEKTDRKCPKCTKPLVIKMGKYGKFMACTGFPECKYTEQIVNKIGLKCPDCKKGDIIERKTRRGKTFWGCSIYPKCKWASWNDPRKAEIKTEALNPKN